MNDIEKLHYLTYPHSYSDSANYETRDKLFNELKDKLKRLKRINKVLKKYEIDDLSVLDQVLENQRFLANHDYSTMRREDFDCLFKELREKRKVLDIILTKRLNIDEIYHEDYEWYMLEHRKDDVCLIPLREEYELIKKYLK